MNSGRRFDTGRRAYPGRSSGVSIDLQTLPGFARYRACSAFPIRKGTYVNIAEPSRWMPSNDSPAAVSPWLVSGRNTLTFNVYAEQPWWERPFDLWARFRVPTQADR